MRKLYAINSIVSYVSGFVRDIRYTQYEIRDTKYEIRDNV